MHNRSVTYQLLSDIRHFLIDHISQWLEIYWLLLILHIHFLYFYMEITFSINFKLVFKNTDNVKKKYCADLKKNIHLPCATLLCCKA